MRPAETTRGIEELVEAHYTSLYRYAYRLAGSASDAEDLTQETFCQAQVKWAQLRDPVRAKAWLFAILRNGYLHRLRSAKAVHQVSFDEVGDLAEPPPQPLPDIDPERLQEALNELPETFRTPLILFYFEDFSYRDIAEQMEVPMGTVMSRLARGRAFLKARLAQFAAAHFTTAGEEEA